MCLLLQLHLVFVQPINWDEFRFLGDVHAHARGELSAVLLTFQVHLFGWLIDLGNETDQIRVARLVMLALEIGTLFVIWTVSRRYFEPAAALFAVLGYVSFSFVLQHGASFRFDPIVTFLLMSAVALLLRDQLRWLDMAGVGLALALATMVSVKVSLAVPLLLAVGAYRLAEAPRRRETFIRLLGATAASVLFLALLYAWHLSTLAGATTDGARRDLTASYAKTLAETDFFPRLQYFVRAVIENPLHWVLLLLGISVVLRSCRKGRGRALLILAFILPLLSIAVYRNAFPYYYAFILAPASIFLAAAASRKEVRKLIGPAAFVLVGGAFIHHRLAMSAESEDQRRTVEVVHAMFPQPVPYIDRCSMIASFPQAGMFLSTWWMENYNAAGRPMMRELLLRTQPVFVIANSPLLTSALEGEAEPQMQRRFFEEDKNLLRSNYVHHWGPIWVAGKSLDVAETGTEAEFLIGGKYLLESRSPIQFEGRRVSPGETLLIEPGKHRVASLSGPHRVLLSWGAGLPRPEASAPTELTFGRF